MSKAPKLLSSIQFASALVYSPRGQSESSKYSRTVRDGLKHQTRAFMRDKFTKFLRDEIEQSYLGTYLRCTLVPMPRSAPLRDAQSRWAGNEICEELARAGLGGTVLPCLERVKAVAKSAFAARGERATAQTHLESMRVNADLLTRPRAITVVDDFVTKGNTLLAGVSLVQAAFPDATVRGFAIIRTMGLVPDVDGVFEPCEGTITWNGFDADRGCS